MSDVPTWYALVLGGLAIFRIYRLIAEDTILDRPRRWALKLGSDWQSEGDPVPPEYREQWALFITCPWCLGFWLSVVWWVSWEIFPSETLWLSVPWALSAVVALTAKNLDKGETP